MSDENAAEERQFACSRCFAIVPESHIHVVPGFHPTLGAYVTSYRCADCWRPTLDETAARLAARLDEDEIVSFCEFLERYNIFVHEFRRGDPLPVVRDILLQTIAMMKDGRIRLPAGDTAAEIDDDPS